MTSIVRLFTAIGLGSLLVGCTTLKGHLVGASSLEDTESPAPGQTDSGLTGYHEILWDQSPF